jgi:hypothetical protein
MCVGLDMQTELPFEPGDDHLYVSMCTRITYASSAAYKGSNSTTCVHGFREQYEVNVKGKEFTVGTLKEIVRIRLAKKREVGSHGCTNGLNTLEDSSQTIYRNLEWNRSLRQTPVDSLDAQSQCVALWTVQRKAINVLSKRVDGRSRTA